MKLPLVRFSVKKFLTFFSLWFVIQEVLSTVETIATEAGVVSGLVESITTAMHHMEDQSVLQSDTPDSFVDYQTRMVTSAKEIARLAQEMV